MYGTKDKYHLYHEHNRQHSNDILGIRKFWEGVRSSLRLREPQLRGKSVKGARLQTSPAATFRFRYLQ